uniref:Uncharacterized protein n=1 Tax=Rhizophora mucronata TaxID=61149 RepID=A0A2P2NR12_RHIMU
MFSSCDEEGLYKKLVNKNTIFYPLENNFSTGVLHFFPPCRVLKIYFLV